MPIIAASGTCPHLCFDTVVNIIKVICLNANVCGLFWKTRNIIKIISVVVIPITNPISDYIISDCTTSNVHTEYIWNYLTISHITKYYLLNSFCAVSFVGYAQIFSCIYIYFVNIVQLNIYIYIYIQLNDIDKFVVVTMMLKLKSESSGNPFY